MNYCKMYHEMNFNQHCREKQLIFPLISAANQQLGKCMVREQRQIEQYTVSSAKYRAISVQYICPNQDELCFHLISFARTALRPCKWSYFLGFLA
jgi:hypothetical protein